MTCIAEEALKKIVHYAEDDRFPLVSTCLSMAQQGLDALKPDPPSVEYIRRDMVEINRRLELALAEVDFCQRQLQHMRDALARVTRVYP